MIFYQIIRKAIISCCKLMCGERARVNLGEQKSAHDSSLKINSRYMIFYQIIRKAIISCCKLMCGVVAVYCVGVGVISVVPSSALTSSSAPSLPMVSPSFTPVSEVLTAADCFSGSTVPIIFSID